MSSIIYTASCKVFIFLFLMVFNFVVVAQRSTEMLSVMLLFLFAVGTHFFCDSRTDVGTFSGNEFVDLEGTANGLVGKSHCTQPGLTRKKYRFVENTGPHQHHLAWLHEVPRIETPLA